MAVVLLTVDCLRADHLGCYGYPRPTTPNVDGFAETATRYQNSYSNCPGTRWAFQSLHTGVSTIRFDGLGIPDGYKSVAERFQAAGYVTGGFAVNGYVSRDYNYDEGFDTYYSVQEAAQRDSLITKAGKKLDALVGSDTLREKVLVPAFRRLRQQSTAQQNRFVPNHTDADTVNRALEFIKNQQAAGNDFFCWIHFMDAHTPYGYWPEHLRAIRGDADIQHTIHPGEEGKVIPGEGPQSEVIDTYDACIRRVDEQMGRIFDVLDEDVSVAITGDHGEEFGLLKELEFHEASVYGTYTQVPLLLRMDGIPPSEKDTPAQHLDIPSTLLTAEGIEVPEHWEGKPLQSAEGEVNDPVFFALSPGQTAVRVGKWKYVDRFGEQELYRVPHMEHETAPVHGNQETREELTTLLEEFREANVVSGSHSAAKREGDELSAAVEANLEDLGYR